MLLCYVEYKALMSQKFRYADIGDLTPLRVLKTSSEEILHFLRVSLLLCCTFVAFMSFFPSFYYLFTTISSSRSFYFQLENFIHYTC